MRRLHFREATVCTANTKLRIAYEGHIRHKVLAHIEN